MMDVPEESKDAYLILEDGTCLKGKSFGAEKTVSGEIGKCPFHLFSNRFPQMFCDSVPDGSCWIPSVSYGPVISSSDPCFNIPAHRQLWGAGCESER